MSELGPTFIKFGQLLSTRPDLIGPELADELSNLQSQTPSDPFDVVKALIEEDLGRPLQEVFAFFGEEPIASASIGQVHRATIREDLLADLRQQGLADLSPQVVVKVRHSGIEKTIETDLDIMLGLADLAERIDDFRPYQPRALVQEISRTMRREVDFQREKNNLTQFRSMFERDKTVLIPQPIASLSSPGVLTMSLIEGQSLKELRADGHGKFKPNEIARRGADLYLKMIFQYGFYHADPHPGNILILPDGRIGLLDFGMVGRVSEHLREDIEAMLVAMVNQDVLMLTTLIKRIGSCPIDLNESMLANDIADFVGHYSTQVLSHFDMSGALRDFVMIVRRYHITLPSEASLLIKVLVTLEGTAQLLDPEFSLMEIMKPIQRMLVIKRLSPTRQMRKMRRFYMQVEQLLNSFPSRLSNILEQVQSGRFDVHLVHRRLGATVNRLVVGLMSSALFLGSALMLSYEVPPLMFPGEGWLGIRNLSMFGVIGMFVSLTMGMRLMLAIRRSGNLDERD